METNKIKKPKKQAQSISIRLPVKYEKPIMKGIKAKMKEGKLNRNECVIAVLMEYFNVKQ